MSSSNSISTANLRQILADVEGKKSTQGLMAAINYLEEDDATLEEVADRYGYTAGWLSQWLDRLERHTDRFDGCLETGEQYEGDVGHTTVEGVQRRVTASGERVTKRGSGDVVRGYIQDITEHKQLERDVEQERDLVTELVETVPVGISVVDPDGSILFVNEEMESIGGRSAEELEEMSYDDARFDLVGKHGEPLEPGDAPFDLLMSQETPIHDHVVGFRRPSGERVWSSVNGAPQYNENGELERAVFAFEDITEQRELEAERAEILGRISDAFIALDETFRVTHVNGRGEELLQRSEDELLGETLWDVYPETEESDEMWDSLRAAMDTQDPQSQEFYHDPGDNWFDVTVYPSESGVSVYFRDVTEQKERERVLRELHTATRELYPPSDVSEIADFLVDFISGAFDLPYVSVKQFDEDTGCLEPAVRSSTAAGESGGLGPVRPGPHPVWKAYEQNEPHRIAGGQYADIPDGIDASINYGLAIPTGEFGVIVACPRESETIEGVDLELIETVAANAESAFQRLHAAEAHADVTAQFAAKEKKVEELAELIDTIQELHGSLAESESRDSLYESVCEKLTGTERIEFAWVGRPRGVETALRPASWAGQESGYLNAIDPDSSDELLPAQRAASEHETCSIQDIGAHARRGTWARRALTAGFRSVVSVPLVYDGVLYGVLSAYSGEEDAFEQAYTDLVTNVAALLVSYSATLESRYQASSEEYTILEFELADPAYPFHQLAVATDARIRFDSVAEITDTEARVFVTVVEGDPETVLDQAVSVSSIAGLTPMGGTRDRQFSVTVRKPFLASIVGKHGARLRDAVSDSSGTTFRVEVPANTSKRPVLDALTTEYREISPLAQRQKTHPDVLDAGQVEDILTERQYEILRAAFYSGYYEAPKQITGEDLATNFDISNTAVYNHLQAGHRKILGAIFEQSAAIEGKVVE